MRDPLDRDDPLEAPERELGVQLASERALPGTEFRGALGRRLAAQDPGFGPRPEHLRRTVSLCLAGGGALAGLGLLQALGML
jgi:hypothetical protein